ncbi:hypothetical protein HERIO_125 [Hepatospora eriocheir]|uniref:Uncharacterized protein n=1 Tax=Hepatospora eriocheir TaxID=1081669 RepID=A0A1X0QE37_9MICR|nr:hypothetical protein HERIO_125 [Hepatospora eriocheir]
MGRNQHFLPAEKLIKLNKKRIELDGIKGIQSFAEKIVTDIINRGSILSKHMGTDIIDSSEISKIIELNYDYTFGLREITGEEDRPAENYIEKMAEISKQK